MQIRETDSGLVGIDQERDSVTLRLDDQSDAPGGGHLFGEEWTEYGIDARRHVHASAVRTDPVSVTVVWPTSDRDRQHLTRGETVRADGECVIVLRTPVLAIVRPEGTAKIRWGDQTVVDLGDGSELTVGFSSRFRSVEHTIRVDRSVDGLKTALTAMGSAINPESPDRSWPSARQTPPRIEWSDTTEVPETPDTGIALGVPSDRALQHLFGTATLGHYLGASFEIRDELDQTILEAPGVDVRVALGSDPETADRSASRWLRRVFNLDCHARSGGPHGLRLDGHDLLGDLGLDADRLYEASLAERLRRYVDVGRDLHREETDSRVPEWHCVVHIDPVTERGRCLHRHLGRLFDVVLPDGDVLDNLGDRSSWSSEETRGPVHQAQSAVVAPEQRGETVGWAGPRRAVGAFNIVGSSHPRRELVADDLSVVVIRTSSDMDAETIKQYRNRLGRLPARVKWIGQPTADDVASAFESDHDLVHVLGHQDDDGIRLPDDSHVPPSVIDNCRAQAFFLNTCGSYHFGERLVERGAAAGAVTTRPVETGAAAAVGRDWASLIALGWCIERALDVVRRRRDPDAYTVVGDGAHVVTQSDSGVPPLVRVDDDQIEISHNGPREAGRRQRDPLSDQPHLVGETRTYERTEERMEQLKRVLDSPIVTSDGLEWL